MTIEIDEAGSFSLLGEAFLFFWRRETNDLIKRRIPLQIYQNTHFKSKSQQMCLKIFKEIQKIMKIPKTEKIYLPKTPMLQKTRDFLTKNEFNLKEYSKGKYLKEMGENHYLKTIITKYSFPRAIDKVSNIKKRNDLMKEWIAEDFPRRKNFVKKGAEIWQKKWKEDLETKWMKQMVNK